MAPLFFVSKRNILHDIVEKRSAQELSEAISWARATNSSDRLIRSVVNEITGGGKSTLSLLVQGQGNKCITAKDSLLKLQQLLPYADKDNILIFWDALKECPDNTEFLKDALYEFLLNETTKMKNELNTQGVNSEKSDEITKLYTILSSLKEVLDCSDKGFKVLIDSYVSFINGKIQEMEEAECNQEEREREENNLNAMKGGGKRKQRKTKRCRKMRKRKSRRY
jgi:hypothetical protein